MDRTIEVMVPANNAHALAHDKANARRVTLVGVSSGIAAGRSLHVKGNAQIEWWSIFTTLDELDTCLADDSLQFQDPVLFARIRREFEHVIRKPRGRGIDSRSCPSNRLCGTGP